jgi:methyl-accepting chemotaxis protein
VFVWFTNIKIGQRIGLCFALCLALAVAIGLSGIQALGRVQQGMETVYKDRVAPLNDLKVVADMYAVNIVDTSHKARNGNLTFSEANESVLKARETIEKSWAAYTATKMMPEEQKIIDELKPLMSAGDAAADSLLAIFKSGNKDRLAQFCAKDLYPAIDPISEKISSLVQLQLDVAKKEYQAGQAIYASSTRSAMTLLVMAILVASVLGFATVRSITRPLSQITHVATGIAAGDVDHTVDHKSKDETGHLAESFRQMIGYLRENSDLAVAVSEGDLTVSARPRSEADKLGHSLSKMVRNLSSLVSSLQAKAVETEHASGQLSEAAAQTGQASQEIARTIEQVTHAVTESAQTSAQIAQGSESLAHEATSAAAAMERLELSIADVNQESAKQQLATDSAAEVAAQGEAAIQETVASMERIQRQVATSVQCVQDLGDKQEMIGDIVKAINDIADQTNLLALNAAIEAARAGEQGRGFAVVAEEVRKLAERSGEATREIGTLIESVRSGVQAATEAMTATASEVEVGAQKSEMVGGALTQILKAIEGVRLAAQENSKSVQEMAVGAKSVTSAITSVASISQETAAGAEEMSASNEEMSAAAEQVSAAVEEQTASAEEVSAMASSLKETASALSELVAEFKTEDRRADLKLAA